MKHTIRAASLALALITGASAAQGQVIVSAVGGVINSGGPGFGTLTETYNQAGLSAGYTSGVTNFASYIAGNPTHTTTFAGYEWFSNNPTTSASVTYNLGAVKQISKLALWNEESSGIGQLNLFGSTDGTNFTALLLGLSPTDNTLAGNYGADVFSFATTGMQYMRLDMDRCPQPVPGSFNACAIGEVAFEASVPEPSTFMLMVAGLAGLGVASRRRRTA